MSSHEFPDTTVLIKSQPDFVQVLDQVSRLVESGRLTPLSSSSDFPTASIEELRRGVVWPDYVDLRFRGCDGRRYRLCVETFHGAGGEWRPE